jgi:outer membrane protein assembly factor BamB
MDLTPISKQKLTLRIAFIAGIFSVIVATIMLLNYWQLKRSDPLESKLMENLVKQLESNRQDETLKEEIRNLDLMARKAYFTKQWQIRTGGYLLVGSMVLLVMALRIFHSLRSRITEPVTTESSLKIELLISQRWILSVIFLIFGFAVIAAFLSDDHLAKSYSLVEGVPEDHGQPIEEITVRSAQDQTPAEVDETRPRAKTNGDENAPAKADTGQDEENLTGEPTGEQTETIPAESKKTASGTASPEDIIRNFPSFRGPYGLGISNHTNIPVDWDGSSGRNILWKVELPAPGYNSPVIWEDHLYITGATENSQVIYCYNRQTGDLVWQHPVNDIPRPGGNIREPTEDTGYAAPTVATDGQHVTAIFASGDVVCLNMNGTRLWGKNLGIPDNHYGHSSSLIIWQNLLMVQFDGNRGGKVMALDINSGQERWTTLRKSKISWASPILARVGGQYELILSSSPQVAGYDPASGKELWAVECLTGEVGPSPAFSDGLVFAANEYAKLVAIRPGANPEIIWETNEYLPEVSSPVADGGILILGTSYGVIACYDDKNGELMWEYECDQGIYASPMMVDGKIYVLDMDGIMHIFKKEKTMNLVGEPELGESAVSTPAFADGKIYLRGMEYLYCIGKK